MGRPSLEERFWSKVQGGDVSACWEWAGSRTPQWTHGNNSQYQRAFQVIKGQIERGELDVNNPPLTELFIYQNYGTTTVGARGVMAWLKAEGLVRGQPGEGVYVTGEKADG